MRSVFGNMKGPISIDFLTKGTTVNFAKSFSNIHLNLKYSNNNAFIFVNLNILADSTLKMARNGGYLAESITDAVCKGNLAFSRKYTCSKRFSVA